MLGSANKLQTARNIKIQGAVSGNANFDGSGNIIINTTQANIAIISGKLTSGEATINYPSGYTKDNCVALSVSFDNDNLTDRRWAYSFVMDSSSYIGGSIPYKLSLGIDNISIETKNIQIRNNEYPYVDESKVDFNYKIVLMKI